MRKALFLAVVLALVGCRHSTAPAGPCRGIRDSMLIAWQGDTSSAIRIVTCGVTLTRP